MIFLHYKLLIVQVVKLCLMFITIIIIIIKIGIWSNEYEMDISFFYILPEYSSSYSYLYYWNHMKIKY